MGGLKQASENGFINSFKQGFMFSFTLKTEVARRNFALVPAKLSSYLSIPTYLVFQVVTRWTAVCPSFWKSLHVWTRSYPFLLVLSVSHHPFPGLSKLVSSANTCLNLSHRRYLTDVANLKCLMPHLCSSPQNLLNLVSCISVHGKSIFPVIQPTNYKVVIVDVFSLKVYIQRAWNSCWSYFQNMTIYHNFCYPSGPKYHHLSSNSSPCFYLCPSPLSGLLSTQQFQWSFKNVS